MTSDPTIPILHYATDPARPPRWRSSIAIAITAAARFAGLSLLLEVFASQIITTRYDPQGFFSTNMYAFWLLFLILSVPTFIITLFSCCLRLDHTTHSLAQRPHLWPFPIIYVATTTALAFAMASANLSGQINHPLAVMSLWFLGAPAISSFFLLKKTNTIDAARQ